MRLKMWVTRLWCVSHWHNNWALSNVNHTHHEFPLGRRGYGDAVPVPLVSRDGPAHGTALQLQVLADVQLLRLRLDHQPQPPLQGVVAQSWWWRRRSEVLMSPACSLLNHNTTDVWLDVSSYCCRTWRHVSIQHVHLSPVAELERFAAVHPADVKPSVVHVHRADHQVGGEAVGHLKTQ